MKQSALSWCLLGSLLVVESAAAAGFLATGPGARAAAMGGAYTAVSDDPAAIYYNPAGLAGQRGAVNVEHVPINEQGAGLSFGDGRLDFLGLQYPSRFGTFGLGVYQFAIGGIEGRQNLGDQATNIGVTQTAYFVPYGIQFGRLALGATAKVVNYSLGTYSGTGYGADVGAKAEVFHGDTFLGRDTRAFLGLAMRNALAPKMTLYQDATAIEQITSLGLSVTTKVREHYTSSEDRVAHDHVTASLDLQRGNLGTPLQAAAGLEYSYLGRYSVRGGVSPTGAITVGLGAGDASSKFRVDYAAGMTQLAPQHHFSVSWFFTDAAAPVEADVHLSAFRRATLDQERLKDRFVREGREAADVGRYEEAYEDFQKALVLDPEDKDVAKLVASAGEGSRLEGVKVRLDAARRERAARNDGLAAQNALAAVQFDPDSKEAGDYAVELRNALISTGTVTAFDFERQSAVQENARKFELAFLDQNVGEMRRIIKRLKAINPDDTASWLPYLRRVFDAEKDWATDYAAQAARAATTNDVLGMARAIRRIRRANENYPQLRELVKRLKSLSKGASSSFYNRNYLRQLYDTAAADYALGNYEEAAQHVAVLLNENALHEAGNALLDRMRDEGRLTLGQEP